MKKLFTVLISILLGANLTYGLVTEKTNTVNLVLADTCDGTFNDFKFQLAGYNYNVFRFQYDVNLAGVDCVFRITKPIEGTIYLDVAATEITVSTTNVSFAIAQTNLPPPGNYYGELLSYSTGTTNYYRSLAQGKLPITWSLYLNDTNYFNRYITNVTVGYVYVHPSWVSPYWITTNSSIAMSNYFETRCDNLDLATGSLNTAIGNLQSSTNSLNTAVINLQISTNALNTRMGNAEAATNALQIQVTANSTSKVSKTGDTMTGPLTNEVGFYGNGAGLTNIAGYATGTPIYVESYQGTITGATIAAGSADAVTVTGPNAAITWNTNAPIIGLNARMANAEGATGFLNTAVADMAANTGKWETAYIDSSSATGNIVSLQASTNALNTRMATAESATNNLNSEISNLKSSTNNLNARLSITETNAVKLVGGIMTGSLTNEAGFYGNGVGLTNVSVLGGGDVYLASNNTFAAGTSNRMPVASVGRLFIDNSGGDEWSLQREINRESDKLRIYNAAAMGIYFSIGTNAIHFHFKENSFECKAPLILSSGIQGDGAGLTNLSLTNLYNATNFLNISIGNLNNATNNLGLSTNALQVQVTSLQNATNTLNTATNALQVQVNVLNTGAVMKVGGIMSGPLTNTVAFHLPANGIVYFGTMTNYIKDQAGTNFLFMAGTQSCNFGWGSP